MKRSRWTLAGVLGGKVGRFVGQCWWEAQGSKGLAYVLSVLAVPANSPITDGALVSLSLLSHPPWYRARKSLPKDTGRQKQDKDFQDRWRGKKGCEILNMTRSHWNEVLCFPFGNFWVLQGGWIAAPLYVSGVSRLEDLKQGLYNTVLVGRSAVYFREKRASQFPLTPLW